MTPGVLRMSNCDDLLAKARNNPKGFRCKDLLALAGCNGWSPDRQRGSHHVFKKKGIKGIMDFQEGNNGEAKAYQVRQLLNTIED